MHVGMKHRNEFRTSQTSICGSYPCPTICYGAGIPSSVSPVLAIIELSYAVLPSGIPFPGWLSYTFVSSVISTFSSGGPILPSASSHPHISMLRCTARLNCRLYSFLSSALPQNSFDASRFTRVRGSYGGCSSSIASTIASMCDCSSSARFGK